MISYGRPIFIQFQMKIQNAF